VQFNCEAIAPDGRVVAEQIDASSRADALDVLRNKGLTPLKVDPATPNRAGERRSHGATERRRDGGEQTSPGGAKSADLVLFTQQLKMLLEAGAALVPALEAIEQQTAKARVKNLVHAIRQHVEQGGTLADAFHDRPDVFKPVFCSMVAAGEATASLPEAFDRLNELTMRQRKTRKTVLGALLYPAILSVLCVAVAGVVIGFVVPRFSTLFENLHSPLPTVTKFLFGMSEKVLDYWPVWATTLIVLIVGGVVVVRTQRLRLRFDALLLKSPVLGPLVSRLVFARVLRIWAAMLRCHVPLLETIQHSRSALTNVAFIRLVDDVEEAVAGGGSIGRTLAESGLVEPVIASAIRTGEENGRLSEAVEFVSDWMDNDNAQLVAGLTRVIEPALLATMGLFVGLVAMSLFIPLFDLATAGA
jgi:type IV pilus assembly protein PilC